MANREVLGRYAKPVKLREVRTIGQGPLERAAGLKAGADMDTTNGGASQSFAADAYGDQNGGAGVSNKRR